MGDLNFSNLKTNNKYQSASKRQSKDRQTETHRQTDREREREREREKVGSKYDLYLPGPVFAHISLWVFEPFKYCSYPKFQLNNTKIKCLRPILTKYNIK